MKYWDQPLPSPEANLACDEILLDLCESGGAEGVLRFWQPAQCFVVVGYANRVACEVNHRFCQRHGIPILRRCSGGGTVLQCPGCLNYSLLLRIGDHPSLAGIASTNEFVLERHQDTLQKLLQAPIQRKGHTDLAVGGLKFCGNAQRRRKEFLLFHGSFLLHADIEMMERVLPLPSRQPDYRLNRSHSEFLMNLRVSPRTLKAALAQTWQALEPLPSVPLDQVELLAEQKYKSTAWNFKF